MTNPKGAAFERKMADYLRAATGQRHIDRKVKEGANDKGDIANVERVPYADRVAVECKNLRTIALAEGLREAEIERVNLAALAGVVIAKRHGKGKPEDQLVYMTAKDFAALLAGYRYEG